jgi:hypothetical protein
MSPERQENAVLAAVCPHCLREVGHRLGCEYEGWHRTVTGKWLPPAVFPASPDEAVEPAREHWVSAEAGSVVRDWPGRVLDEEPVDALTRDVLGRSIPAETVGVGPRENIIQACPACVDTNGFHEAWCPKLGRLGERPGGGFTMEQWASIRDAVRHEVARVTGRSDTEVPPDRDAEYLRGLAIYDPESKPVINADDRDRLRRIADRIDRDETSPAFRDVVDAAQYKELAGEFGRAVDLASTVLDVLQPRTAARPGDLPTMLEVIFHQVQLLRNRLHRLRLVATEEV